MTERLSKGVGARLFRYAAVLAQAKKTGRARITSQELAAYTGVNATQIRRDLSSFGTFGRRGIGYSVDRLLGELREILFMERKHRAALVGAGRLGQAIANSPIFAEQGVTIATIFDRDPAKVGQQFGGVSVSDSAGLGDVILGQEIVVAVLAIPAVSGAEFEQHVASLGGRLLRPDRKDEQPRFGSLGRIRQWIESTFDTLKDQLSLERHGGRALNGLISRIARRLLALTAVILHNWRIGTPGRNLTAYDH